jgi:hypothetical protein
MTVAPLIHGNGTSKDELKRNLESAFDAVAAAALVLRQCSPNGRDYYMGNVLMTEAERQHRSRMGSLVGVMNSIETEMELIDQDKQREE